MRPSLGRRWATAISRAGRINGLRIGAEGPADDLPVIQVKNCREIYPAGFGTQDVGNPFFSAPFGMKLTVQQVFANRGPVV
jgi:hypothetical protein